MIVHTDPDSTTRTAREVGAAVRRSRHALGLRQDELALAAGVGTRTIHQIESGKRTSRLDSLAAVLEVLGLRLKVEERGAIDSAHDQDR